MQLNEEKITPVFRAAILLSILAVLSAVLVYAYLGSFSRFLADDYCEAQRMTSASSPLQAVLDRYTVGAWRAANRYSNILFVGFSEMLGENSIPITIVAMIALWAGGLIWLAHEVRRFSGLTWSSRIDVFLGSLLAFMSLLQAPTLFQTVFWRSSMMTHFAPLVFGVLLFAFLLRQAQRPPNETVSLFTYGFILFAFFVLAGFSEPPTATLVTLLALLLIAIWVWNKSPIRSRLFALTGSAFAGIFSGFLVLLFSPAVTDVAREKSPDLFLIFYNSFSYGFMFVRDSFSTLPLPLFLSGLLPLLLIWSLKQSGVIHPNLDPRRLPAWMLLLPFLVWLLIAAGFSPSVFGQGFPVERMRFLARAWIIAALLLEGIWLGFYLPGFKVNRTLAAGFALVVFSIIAIAYPIRTAINLSRSSVPEYRERAHLWDLRKAFIVRHKAQGETDLIIPAFSGIYGVKELDSNPAHWINACAAELYGVSSIQAFTNPNILEALNE